MMRWKDEIVNALKALGGIASYHDIYNQIQLTTSRNLTSEWQATIRREIENHSSESNNYRGGDDTFYPVEGIGRGIWGLREMISIPTIIAIDFEEPNEPQRVKQYTYRILRDTFLSRSIKALYKNSCQICGESIDIKGNLYAEAHHIKPLGRPHNGPDIAANIIILCPNHHVMFDYGAIPLELDILNIHPDHRISKEFIEYYNQVIVNT